MNGEDDPDVASVGPVLEACEETDAVLEALRGSNADVTVKDRGQYVRVLVRRRCTLERALVERALGRPFRLPGDLERIMLSFKGHFAVTEHRAEWRVEDGP